jgi:hypothetical protein
VCCPQVAEDDRAAAAAEEAQGDPEVHAAAQQAARLRDAEEWRMQQLRTGAADANANFAPVLGDWRQRLRRTPSPERQQAEQRPDEGMRAVKRRGKRAQAVAESSSEVEADSMMPDLEAESAGLPPGWRAMWDKTHRRLYYGNLETSVSAAGVERGRFHTVTLSCGAVSCLSYKHEHTPRVPHDLLPFMQ